MAPRPGVFSPLSHVSDGVYERRLFLRKEGSGFVSSLDAQSPVAGMSSHQEPLTPRVTVSWQGPEAFLKPSRTGAGASSRAGRAGRDELTPSGPDSGARV